MGDRLKEELDRLRTTFWFVPGLIVVAAILLALVTIWIDGRVGAEALRRLPRLFGADAESSRAMLSAIASSMITVAGVTFSITIVAVAQAASQYSSRLLRSFMRDPGNQSVLGVLVGVFVYCLVVLRTVRGDDDIRFIPALSVVIAFVLAIVAIGFLIFFMHNIARSLQASTLLSEVTDETLHAVERLFPQELGEEADADEGARADELARAHAWTPVPSRRSGYIQSVRTEDLLAIAGEHRVLVRMERGVGEFVVQGSPLVSLGDVERVDERVVERLNDAFVTHSHRTVYQDAAFGIRQLVDVALRALSPGINDVTTAINSIDYLSVVLSRLAARRIEPLVRRDGGEPRVIARGPTFVDLLDAAFDEIRRAAEGKVSVLGRLLTAIETVSGFARDRGRRLELLRHVEQIRSAARRTVEEPEALREIERRCDEVGARLA